MDNKNSYPYMNYLSSKGATPYHSFLSYYGPSSIQSIPNGGGANQQQPINNSNHNPSNTSSPMSTGAAQPATITAPNRQPTGYRAAYHLGPYSLTNPNYSPYRHGNHSSVHHGQPSPIHHQHYSPNLRYYSSSAPYYCIGSNQTNFHPSVKLQQLGNRLQSWKTASIGISFLVLLLLICKLHDVDREINYLHFISNEWLSQQAVNQQLLSSGSSSVSSPEIPLAAGSIDQSMNGGDGGGRLESRSDRSHNLYSLVYNGTGNSDDNNNVHDVDGANSVLHYLSTPAVSSPFVASQDPSQSMMQQVTTSRLLTKPRLIGSSNQNFHSMHQPHHPPAPSPVAGFHQHHHHHQQQQQQQANHHQPPAQPSSMHHDENHRSSSAQNLIVAAIDHHQPQPLNPSTDVLDLANIISVISYLKEDVDVLMGELMASRTTLLLSLVFVLVYILSWCWMAYAIRATNTPQDISLKTVLLLAIFAAVDIAASAGFVMVRIIMYLMRDHYFPRDMRMPVHSIEYSQFAAYVALRLTSMKSATGVIDIFVSVIVTFLTSLRVYSVICAVAFYRRARKELISVKNFEYMIERPRFSVSQTSHHHGHHPSYIRGSMANMKPSPANSTGAKADSGDLGQSGYLPKIRLLSAHKDLERRFSVNGRDVNNGNNSGVENSSSDVSSDEDPAQELKIQAADMPASIQKSAMQSTIHALRTYTTEKHIAESIKQNFDQLYEPTWHCIVGRNWGSCVTHTKSNYIRMLYKDLTILLYKSS